MTAAELQTGSLIEMPQLQSQNLIKYYTNKPKSQKENQINLAQCAAGWGRFHLSY